MVMRVESYLNFDGRTEEALQFYRTTLGAEVTMLLRFSEGPECEPGMIPPGAANKVMHSSFRIGETNVMASDCHCHGKPNFQGFSLSIALPTEAEVQRIFGALSEGGQVQQPLTKTFFSPAFGVLTDRFGVSWMILVSQQA
jgi:PhnB protein